MTLIDPNTGIYSLPQKGRIGRAPGAESVAPRTPIDGNTGPANALRADFVEISRSAKAALSSTAPSAESGAKAQPGAQDSPGTYSRADVKDLLSSWGDVKPGSAHDHNGDGRVNASDLAALIAKLGQPKPEPVSEQPAPYTQDDVQSLLKEWGGGAERTVNERYDFNADGRIDASDLAALIARLGGSSG